MGFGLKIGSEHFSGLRTSLGLGPVGLAEGLGTLEPQSSASVSSILLASLFGLLVLLSFISTISLCVF